MGYKENYESWLNNPYFDEDTRNELKSIEGNEKEIEDRFYMDLEFGTAGLRGVIGAGTNRMNIYTVRKATQGLANYISRVNGQKRGVAIAYDSRHMSPEFADEAALCLAANGIKAYVFESLRPTPELSYAVRKLGCIAGINVTASHNPPEYNGYKVYWEDGAQITPPHDTGIMDEVKKVTDYAAVKTMPLDEAKAAGLYQVIGADIDDPYIAELKKLVLHQDCIDKVGGELKIVYTPLHGTGNIPVRRVLKELGFKNVYVVPEQELPDGDFPTVSYPNPEAAEAFELGLALGKKVDADLIRLIDEVFGDIKTSYSNTDLIALASQIFNYSLGETTGFPFEKNTVTLGSKGSVVVPCDLKSNVIQLHQFLYDDTEYEPTDTVKSNSEKIISDTGFHQGDGEIVIPVKMPVTCDS